MSVKENALSGPKTPFVNDVQAAVGVETSAEARSRYGAPGGPEPATTIIPFTPLAIPVNIGVRTIRKIVPPPPGPPFAVEPYRFPSGPSARDTPGLEPLVPWN